MLKITNYNLIKLSSTDIIRNANKKWQASNLTRAQAKDQNKLVDMADNILFREIRKINGDSDSQKMKQSYIAEARKRINEIKKQTDCEENRIVLAEAVDQLNDSLFIPELVLVVTNKTAHQKWGTRGFDFNGRHFVRHCASAGNLKNNTVLFVDEQYHNKINNSLYAKQLDVESKPLVVPEKHGAYIGLSTTGTLFVSRPRVCVIPDFKHKLPTKEKVRFVSEVVDENGKTRHDIVEKYFDDELNSFDGQGLVTSIFAQKWCDEIEIDYLPSAFNIRAVGTKGLLVVMDLCEFAREHQIVSIKDLSGRDIPVEQIDVILTESQWKMHALYNDDWTVFDQAQVENDHAWGIQRCSPEKDKEKIKLNYQLLQTSGLIDDQDISDLLEPTKDYYRRLADGDEKLIVELLTGEVQNEDDDYNFDDDNDDDDEKWGSNHFIVSAIRKNKNLSKDPHIQETIANAIRKSLDLAKIGKVWVRGNYSFMISDPLALLEWACFRDPKKVRGLLDPYHVYSRFWLDKNVNKILACRAPMTDPSEHNLLTVANSNLQTKKYYKYINSGIIYSIWDISTIIHSDSDFDSDLVLTTDNAALINNIWTDINGNRMAPITYSKGISPRKELYTPARAVISDCRGFGNKVGQYSNYSTAFYGMLPNFTQESDRQKVIDNIAILRYVIGQEIDSTKSGIKPNIPAEFVYQKLEWSDSEETRAAKVKHNQFTPKFLPYFFRYKYQEKNTLWQKHFAIMDTVCRRQLFITLADLLKLDDSSLNENERVFKANFFDYTPLLKNSCVVNKICQQMEALSKEIAVKMRDLGENEESMLINHAVDVPVSDITRKRLKAIYTRHCRQIADLTKKQNTEYNHKNEKVVKLLCHTKKQHINLCAKADLYGVINNTVDLVNALAATLEKTKRANKFVWTVLGSDVLDVIVEAEREMST